MRRAPAALRSDPVAGAVLLLRGAPPPLQPVNKPSARELVLPPPRPRGGGPEAQTVPESFWVSLRYFNAYRIAIAGLFFVSGLAYGDLLSLASQNVRLFAATSAVYLLAAIAYQVILTRVPRSFDTQLTVHVCTDVVVTGLLMFASGGFRSGLAVMLLISIAAASLVSRGRRLLFYAALATIVVLVEQAVEVVVHGDPVGGFVPPALISVGYFATAFITNQLAQRVITNERVARQRGIDLANQLRINQLVIQDVQDGVLVVDSNGLVRSHNRRVDQLLRRPAPALDQIDTYSPELAQALAGWRRGAGPA